MLDTPTTADEYPRGQLDLVKATCLSLVVALGDKDAHDLYYMAQNFGGRIEDVADALRPLRGHPQVERAMAILKEDFSNPDGLGPRCAAQFVYKGPDEVLQADVAGVINDLLRRIG